MVSAQNTNFLVLSADIKTSQLPKLSTLKGSSLTDEITALRNEAAMYRLADACLAFKEAGAQEHAETVLKMGEQVFGTVEFAGAMQRAGRWGPLLDLKMESEEQRSGKQCVGVSTGRDVDPGVTIYCLRTCWLELEAYCPIGKSWKASQSHLTFHSAHNDLVSSTTMPFPFTLPTTSSVSFDSFYSSRTHPSLCLNATTKRTVVKDALKKYKHLASRDKATHLSGVHDALSCYLPFLLALDRASSMRDVGDERIDLEVTRAFEAEWRVTLSTTLPGRDAQRPKLVGLHHEIAFTLSTLACVHSLLARSKLRMLYDTGNAISADQKTAAIGAAMRHLLDAHSIHTYLLSLPSVSAASDAPVDIRPSTISALASLSLAEATLIVVAKDDPYAAAVADDRNDTNKDWMYKAPSIPKIRSHLFARICLAAAEHAHNSSGLLSQTSNGKIDENLVKYAADLRRTARGKAARFLAIDAELSGKTGEALAWLHGAKRELGLFVDLEDGKRKGFRGLKQSWQEFKEDRKLEKGGEWGMDAGRFEEARVVEMLEAKWDRENSTVNVQVVPPSEPLIANMPSGREYHSPQLYIPPMLDAEALARMRAPLDPTESPFRGSEDDSGDEAAYKSPVPGGFPGSGVDLGRNQTGHSYY